MKTRLSALAVVISSSMLAACGSGGPGSFTSDAPPPAPTPAPAPTVTVTAPATATAGFAFTAGWTSTDATSCDAGDLSTVTDPNPTAFSKTETVAGTKTYSVTCTGAGGSATGTATVVVDAAPTAEGAWQGTTGDGRTVSGVVTKEGVYWLSYTQAGNGAVVGFYTGTGVSTPTTPTAGTFASSGLREINFAGGFDGGGNAAAGAISSGVFTKKQSLAGSLDAVAGGAISSATFNNITGSGSAGNGFVSITSTSSAPTIINDDATQVTVKMTTDYTILANPADPESVDTHLVTLTATAVFSGSVSGSVFNVTGGTYTTDSCDDGYGGATGICGLQPVPVGQAATFAPEDVGGSVDLAAGGTVHWALGPVGDQSRRGETYTFPAPTSTTLSSLPSITAGTFDLSTYVPAYEIAPALATLTGDYTGSAGVGVAMQTGATFTISPVGAIVGDAGSCHYEGSAATHPAGGNVYDITLTFSGESCANSGDFAGVATYDAETHQVTVTTVNTARDTGFLFVGVPAD